MLITTQTLALIAGGPANANMTSFVLGLQDLGDDLGLTPPHRLAMYLGQWAHESMGWYYDREVWGPTPAQLRYEGRADLGNVYKGDGSKFRGYTAAQLTGRSNVTQFTRWVRLRNPKAPDFTVDPAKMNTDPWEGYGPLWYWSTRNLNGLADQGLFDTITLRINGGYNGKQDRRDRYGRAAMVLMGRPARDLPNWQRESGLSADGIVGPNTMARLFTDLRKLPPVTFNPSRQVVSGTDWLSRLLRSIFGAWT